VCGKPPDYRVRPADLRRVGTDLGGSPDTDCRRAHRRSARTRRQARLLSGRPRPWPAGCAGPPCSRGRADQAKEARGHPRRPAAATGHGDQTVPAMWRRQADGFRTASGFCDTSEPTGSVKPGTTGVWSSTTTTSLTNATHCGLDYYQCCGTNLANAPASRSNAGSLPCTLARGPTTPAEYALLVEGESGAASNTDRHVLRASNGPDRRDCFNTDRRAVIGARLSERWPTAQQSQFGPIDSRPSRTFMHRQTWGECPHLPAPTGRRPGSQPAIWAAALTMAVAGSRLRCRDHYRPRRWGEAWTGRRG
jgi:hypothetical protein